MDLLLTILGFTLPSVIMFLAVWFVLKKTLRNENEILAFELKKQNNNNNNYALAA